MNSPESSRNLDGDYRCQTRAVARTISTHAKPVLYMMLSTALLMLLVLMFAQGFGPANRINNDQYEFRHHVSHNTVQEANLMRI